MTRTILEIMGTILLMVGIVGFASPGFGGTHLSVAHNVIPLVSGMLALWFGFKGTFSGARTFSWVFGLGYGLLGVAGMLFGYPGTPMLGEMGSDPKLLTVIPNILELGRNDHILHIVMGMVFLAAAMMSRPFRRMATEPSRTS
jgi:hypothetical protein